MVADTPESAEWLRLLEERFGAALAVRAPRAALGLRAVLQCWRGSHGVCRVALPGAICHEVVVAVLAAGCEAIFCDVSIADGLVKDSEWVRARNQGANVALVTHLYGNPARMSPIRTYFAAPDCLIVDDAAQALGSQSEEGIAGALGDVGLLSFGATKQLPLGNAAVLFRNADFGAEVRTALDATIPEFDSKRVALAQSFRVRLEIARERLRRGQPRETASFASLLDGLEPLLRVPWVADVDGALLKALRQYPQAMAARIEKARLWSDLLDGERLRPIGMASGCVPWRYVCRLPGAGWVSQYRLATALRERGMHVSNWYLPANWFVDGSPTLPGVETLSQEVFQFWIDEGVTHEEIMKNATVVKRELARLGRA